MRRIEAVRRGKGLSQAALGRLAEMHPATVGQIESGYIGRPYPKQLARLSGALGWPLNRATELLDEVSGDE